MNEQPETKYRKGCKVDKKIPVPRVSERARKAPKKLDLYYC